MEGLFQEEVKLKIFFVFVFVFFIIIIILYLLMVFMSKCGVNLRHRSLYYAQLFFFLSTLVAIYKVFFLNSCSGLSIFERLINRTNFSSATFPKVSIQMNQN